MEYKLYSDKVDISSKFVEADFVNVFSQVRTSIDDNGKEYSNVRVLFLELLKAKEQMGKRRKERVSTRCN